MTLPTDLIFWTAVPVLFWSLLGVIAPQLLRLPSSWFAASLSGFAFIALYAAVELHPGRQESDYEFPFLLAAWGITCLAAVTLRVAIAAYLFSKGRRSRETGIVRRLAVAWKHQDAD